MNSLLIKLFEMFQDLKNRDEGQDMVEYALVVGLISFGATAGMGSLAGGISTAYVNVSGTLAANITCILA